MMACCFLAFVNSYLNWLRFLIFDLKSAFGCLTYNILSFVIIISIYSFQGTIWLVSILPDPGSVIYNKKFPLGLLLITDHWSSVFFFLIRRPPTLPCRLQHSTIGRSGLNHRVRDGNGCCPWAHRHRNFLLSKRYSPYWVRKRLCTRYLITQQ